MIAGRVTGNPRPCPQAYIQAMAKGRPTSRHMYVLSVRFMNLTHYSKTSVYSNPFLSFLLVLSNCYFHTCISVPRPEATEMTNTKYVCHSTGPLAVLAKPGLLRIPIMLEGDGTSCCNTDVASLTKFCYP